MENKHVEHLINEATSTAEAIFKAAEEGEHNVDLPELAQQAGELIGRLRQAAAQQHEQVIVMREFVEQVSVMSIWDFDNDQGNQYNECDEPDDGYNDSHAALMGTIEQSRALLDEKLPALQTVNELVDRVLRTAVKARQQGHSVVIDRLLPTVAIVHGPDQEYFFQEHEAKALIDDWEMAVESLVNETHQALDLEDYILYLSQGW